MERKVRQYFPLARSRWRTSHSRCTLRAELLPRPFPSPTRNSSWTRRHWISSFIIIPDSSQAGMEQLRPVHLSLQQPKIHTLSPAQLIWSALYPPRVGSRRAIAHLSISLVRTGKLRTLRTSFLEREPRLQFSFPKWSQSLLSIMQEQSEMNS